MRNLIPSKDNSIQPNGAIGKQIGCKFFVDDATDYLEHRSAEKLNEYIMTFEIPRFESPDLLRKTIIEQCKEE